MKFPYLTFSGFFVGFATGAAVAGKLGFMGMAFVSVSMFTGLWGGTMVEVLGTALMIRVLLASMQQVAILRKLPPP